MELGEGNERNTFTVQAALVGCFEEMDDTHHNRESIALLEPRVEEVRRDVKMKCDKQID